MANEVGTAFVGVEFSKQAINGALAMLQGELTGGLGRIGKLLPKGAIGVGIAGAVAGGAVLVTKELYDIGKEFVGMRDTIRTETGASGKALDGLVASAKNVFKQVPDSADEVAQALAQVDIRVGGTTKQIENMTKKQLELARVTKSEVVPQIEATTKAFNVWELSQNNASRGLDAMFVSSQKTGTSINEIAGIVQRFARPLQGLGFSFNQATALAGAFGKEGLNTTKVMGGLVIGLGNIAKEGKDPITTFAALATKIKNASTTTDALQLAIKVFGKRAAVDLVGAIRSGALSVDDLTSKLGKSRGAIHDADEQSKHLSEHWKELKHVLKVAVAPQSEAVFKGLDDAMVGLSKHLPEIRAQLAPLGDAFRTFTADVQAASPIWQALGRVITAQFKALVQTVQGAVQIIGGALQVLTGLLTLNFGQAFDGLKQMFAGLGPLLTGAVNNILAPFEALVPGITAKFSNAGHAAVSGFVSGIRSAISAVTSAVSAVRSAVTTAVSGAASWVVNAGRAVVNGFVSGVRGAYGAVTSAVAAFRGRAVAAVASAASWAVAAGRAVVSGFVGGIRGAYGSITGAANGFKGRITSVTSSALSWLVAAGRAIVDGLAHGIRAAIGNAVGAAQELADKVKGVLSGVKGFLFGSPSKVTYQYGQWIVDGLATGITAHTPKAEKAARELAQRTLTAAREVVKGAAGSLSQALSDAFSGVQAAQQTQSEQALAALQAQHDAAARAQALADAQTQLAAAQTADETARAQQAVADAQYAITVASLEASAAVERRALDDQQRAQQRAFDARVKALTTYLTSNSATVAGARKQIAKLLKDFGVDFETVGEQVGKSFVTGLEKSAAAIEKALANVRKKTSGGTADGYTQVGGSSYSAGVAQAPSVRTGVGATSAGGGTLAGTVTPAQRLARALAGVAVRAAGEAAPSLDGLALHVYIGDQELRGLVRSEVVRNDSGIARTLLAGAR